MPKGPKARSAATLRLDQPGLIPGESWRPYQDVAFVTPAFPEYTSGHAGFSFAAAIVLEAYTGSDVLFDWQSRGVRDLDSDSAMDLIGRCVGAPIN